MDLIKFKVAQPADYNQVVALGKELWMYVDHSNAEYDPEGVDKFLAFDPVVTMIAKFKNEIVAVLSVIVTPIIGAMNDSMACEWLFYVKHSYRREGIARDLVTSMEEHLKHEGLSDKLVMMSLESYKPYATKGLYKSLGYHKKETVYLKEF